MKLLRAWTTLVWLSFRRLFWSLNTFMVLFPLAGAALFIVRWRRWLDAMPSQDAFSRFSEVFVVPIFTLFLLPICALAYATSSIGGDREDRTLLFLLVRPIPRWLILFAKWSATLPIVLALVLGSFYFYCHLALPGSGTEVFRTYLPPVFLMTLAYVSLFHLFAVMFRHATITALVYALFMEALLGNMPGVIKRVAVSFYGRSMMYRHVGDQFLEEPTVFESLPLVTSAWALVAIAVGGLLLGALIFSRREYRDLA